LQINPYPTRKENIIDPVLTDDNLLVSIIAIGHPLSRSDHCSLELKISLPSVISGKIVPPLPKKKRVNTNWPGFKTYVESTDWQHVYINCTNPTDYWKIFLSLLRKGIDLYVPLKPKRKIIKNNKTRLPFGLLSRKKKLWKALRQTPMDIALKIKYRECQPLANPYGYCSKN